MTSADDIFACGLVIRPHEHAVYAHGQELDLTLREYEILSKLVQNPGWVLSLQELSSDSSLGDYSPESVSVLIARLRAKMARAGIRDAIETVRGLGYRLQAPTDSTEPAEENRPEGTPVLRDAFWRLQEAVIAVEHSGSDEHRVAAIEAMERARRDIYAALAR